jgi:hypothetical protein
MSYRKRNRLALAAAIAIALFVGLWVHMGVALAGPAGSVEVKLSAASDLDLRSGQLVDQRGEPALTSPERGVTRAKRVFDRAATDLRAEREAAEARSGDELADLTRWYRLEPAP